MLYGMKIRNLWQAQCIAEKTIWVKFIPEITWVPSVKDTRKLCLIENEIDLFKGFIGDNNFSVRSDVNQTCLWYSLCLMLEGMLPGRSGNILIMMLSRDIPNLTTTEAVHFGV
jgi:hypothetical protein